MNFFAEQERARRKTLVLIGLMTAAVASLILMTAVTIGAVLHFVQQPTDSNTVVINLQNTWREHFLGILQSDILYYAAAGVLTVVLGGSIFKLLQLGGSGRRVAEALGGRLILSNTNNAMERKTLNIVEEMAIASGNPVPPVYLLEEAGINAFAAGTDRRNAVIGVTRGCIELLNRDELQGVIAHEFSHIHNGDMRLNLRLVAILHGILLIGLIGSMLLRSSSRHNRKNQGAQLGLGLAFVILGYCGVFFGNLIKAAVSRQRVMRQFARSYRKAGGKVGPGLDIQAGDVNTKAPEMKVLAQTYGSKARPSSGVSGKAVVKKAAMAIVYRGDYRVAIYLENLQRAPFLPAYLLSELHHHPERVEQVLASITGGAPGAMMRPLFRKLGTQIDERVRAGTMRPIDPEQFAANLISLCIFPFAARPMFRIMFEMDDARFAAFVDRRKTDIPAFVRSALRP